MKLADLKAGTRHWTVRPWPPHPEVQVGLRPLTGTELREARILALGGLAGVPDVPGGGLARQELYEEDLGYQCLVKALVDVDTGEAFVSDAKTLRDQLTPDQAVGLLEDLLTHPGQHSLQNSALALVEKADDLGKASAPGTVSNSNWDATPKPSLGFRVLTSPKGNSSTFSPSTGPSMGSPLEEVRTPPPPSSGALGRSPGDS